MIDASAWLYVAATLIVAGALYLRSVGRAELATKERKRALFQKGWDARAQNLKEPPKSDDEVESYWINSGWMMQSFSTNMKDKPVSFFFDLAWRQNGH